MKKKILSALLAAVLIFAALSMLSCEVTTDNPAESSGESAETGDKPLTFHRSDLPMDHDLDGHAVTVYQRQPDITSVIYNILWDEDYLAGSANKLNEAVYKRNIEVQKQYNCDIITSYHTSDVTTKLNELILANDSTYDVGITSVKICLKLLSPNLYYDLDSVPYINTSKDYWDQNFIEQTNIAGKIYIGVGNILVSDDDAQTVLLWQKDYAKDLQIGDRYETARKGAFTWDVMFSDMKSAIKDLNGDFGYSLTDDSMGLLYAFNNVTFPFLASADYRVYKNTSDGFPELDESNLERLDNIVEKLREMLHYDGATNDWIMGFGNGDARAQIAGMQTALEDKRTLYLMPVLSQIRRNYSDIKADFGILPLPKFDDKQEDYHTTLYGDYDGIVFPTTTGGELLDAAGFVFEALAAASDDINTAYYNISLENRYLRDPEQDMEMLALARRNVNYDLGAFYDWGVSNLIDTHVLDKYSTRTISTIYAGYAKSAKQKVEDFIDKVLADD